MVCEGGKWRKGPCHYPLPDLPGVETQGFALSRLQPGTGNPGLHF